MTMRGRRGSSVDGVDLLVLLLFAALVVLAALRLFTTGVEASAALLLGAGVAGFMVLGVLILRSTIRCAVSFPLCFARYVLLGWRGSVNGV